MPTQSNTTCQHCGRAFHAQPHLLKRGHAKFCGMECYRASMRQLVGEKARHWKGGRIVDDQGYIHVRLPGKGYQREHRLVMASALGRSLRPDEDVHHKDGDPTNNDPDNLVLTNDTDHPTLHRIRETLWSRQQRSCLGCGTTERPHLARGMCQRCYDAQRRSHGF